MPLCEACECILKNLDPAVPERFKFRYLAILPFTAPNSECPSCAIIYPKGMPLKLTTGGLLQLSLGPMSEPSFHCQKRNGRMYRRKHCFVRLHYGSLHRGLQDESQDLRSFDIEISEDNQFLSNLPLSDARLLQAKSWLNQCVSGHTICDTRYDLEFRPTRLIDVGRKGVSPKLIITSGSVLGSDKYFALSHCWGTSIPKQGTTTTTTISDRLAKIPLNHLPKTFKEAIKVTRRLGVQYIWIDSLCIIQDSTEDWQRESGLMGKVYSNSHCMLAAAGSKNCHGGLFQDPSDFAIMRESERNEDIHIHGVLLKPLCLPWPDAVSQSPLNKRAWTLQERELSPRIVYFMNNTLYFECRECRAEGKLSIGGEIERYGIFPKIPFVKFISSRSDPAIPLLVKTHPDVKRCMDPVVTRNGQIQWLEIGIPQQRYNSWLDMVEGYSRRTLSFPSDKFPAISGLATEYTYLLKDQYAAGIWRRDLFRGLCWTVEQQEPYPTISDYGPSWSWAKVNGPVHYRALETADRMERVYPIDSYLDVSNMPYISEVSTTSAGSDPNGTLKSSYIRMEAQLYPLRLEAKTKWYVENANVSIFWDTTWSGFKTYWVLVLDWIGVGLVLRKVYAPNTYIRVGIFKLSPYYIQNLFHSEGYNNQNPSRVTITLI